MAGGQGKHSTKSPIIKEPLSGAEGQGLSFSVLFYLLSSHLEFGNITSNKGHPSNKD